jgi:hypothetical protein
MREASLEASIFVTSPMPLLPSTSPFQYALTPSPTGVTAPMPVITTFSVIFGSILSLFAQLHSIIKSEWSPGEASDQLHRCLPKEWLSIRDSFNHLILKNKIFL